MITKLDAILSLRPLAEFTLRGDELDWLDSKQTEPVQSEIDAEVARLQADHDSKAYARARADAYASIGDQLDMQYHDSVNGSRTWLDHIEAVKEAHPK
tara:strand:+ start:268 stop:561 length:294 start_codon:yes stop_codon:yes gene_type:complete